jgi:hypothetical protein
VILIGNNLKIFRWENWEWQKNRKDFPKFIGNLLESSSISINSSTQESDSRKLLPKSSKNGKLWMKMPNKICKNSMYKEVVKDF